MGREEFLKLSRKERIVHILEWDMIALEDNKSFDTALFVQSIIDKMNNNIKLNEEESEYIQELLEACNER
jgi:hypothetical protein